MIPLVPAAHSIHHNALKMMGALIKVDEVTFRKILSEN